MMIALHKNASTTPAVRAKIAANNEAAPVFAARYGITEPTVYKRKKRQVFTDRSHMAHGLQTKLNSVPEAVIAELRKTLLSSLGDLLTVIREFINLDVFRSGLDRCPQCHGMGNLHGLRLARPKSRCTSSARTANWALCISM